MGAGQSSPGRDPNLRIVPEVREALACGKPIVALESTVLAQGLPWPTNLEVGTSIEAAIRADGAVPATIAVIDGVPTIGVTDDELERIARGVDVIKLSTRELALARARRMTGATTVAATVFLANRAGIAVFATGGIGGVHRGTVPDASADLIELGRTPMVVVCAGAKSILDLPATREALETLGILLLGWETDRMPGFYIRDSGLPVDARVDDPAEVAGIWYEHRKNDSPGSIVIGVPVPPDAEIPADVAGAAIESAIESAERIGIRGKDLTPFLLRELNAATGGDALRANVALLRNNARVATSIAREISGMTIRES